MPGSRTWLVSRSCGETLSLRVWKPHLLPHISWTAGRQIQTTVREDGHNSWLEAQEKKPPEPESLSGGVLTQQSLGPSGKGQELGGTYGGTCRWLHAWAQNPGRQS